MRNLIFILVIMIASTIAISAQSNEYYVGYQFNHEDLQKSSVSVFDSITNASGAITSYTRYLDSGNRFGVTGEVGVNYKSSRNNSVTTMGGVTLKSRHFSDYFDPYVKALVGVARKKANTTSFVNPVDSKFAYALGAGLDFKVGSKTGLRVGADVVNTEFYGGRNNTLRLHTGLVW